MSRPDPSQTAHKRVVKTLSPAQAGAVKLTRRYGDPLVCVRHRQDATGKIRYTNVELMVEQALIQQRPKQRTMVGVRMHPEEILLLAHTRATGAEWEYRAGLRKISMRIASMLSLTHRIKKAPD